MTAKGVKRRTVGEIVAVEKRKEIIVQRQRLKKAISRMPLISLNLRTYGNLY